MKKPLTLRRGFAASRGSGPRDVETVTEALRATGILPRPRRGARAPSPAELDRARRRFQDREGLVVDGLARPGGPTERHLSHMVERRAELAARPPRTGPIRFGTLTAHNHRESRDMARGIVRRDDHRSAVAFLRQIFEDDPGGTLPEAMLLADRVDDLDRKQGVRFRADLVKMLGVVQPTLAPIMASGRIPDGGSTHVGTSLLSPAAFSAKAGRDERAGPAGSTAPKAQTGADAGAMFDRIVSPTVPDPTRTELERAARMTPEERRRQRLDGFEREFEGRISSWRKEDMPQSSRFMGHYLNGTGEALGLTREEAREFKLVRDAEAENRQRVEQSFVERVSPSSADQKFFKGVLNLPDGATDVDLGTDNWQVAYEKGSELSDRDPGDEPDFANSFGQVAVNAEVAATASRTGDTITVTGEVEHWLFDVYDFGGVAGFESKAAELEEAGLARQFQVGAGWKQRFTATIEIVDGKPRIEEFRWIDTDEPVNWQANGQAAAKERKAKDAADASQSHAFKP